MLFQALMLITSVIVNQYLNSFITETLSEAVSNCYLFENKKTHILNWKNLIFFFQTARLRIAVYDSSWYNMPKKCQVNIHLLQTLVSYSPKLTTLLGARCDKEFLSKVITYLSTLLSTWYNLVNIQRLLLKKRRKYFNQYCSVSGHKCILLLFQCASFDESG